MRLSPPNTVLFVVLLLFLAYPCCGYVQIALPNADMTTFQFGVADSWTAFTAGDNLPPLLDFFADSGNFRSPPYAQGITGIDVIGLPDSPYGAGVVRQVSAVPGRVYLFIGFQDIFDQSFAQPLSRRFAHFFGISPEGQLTPPDPFTMGHVRWMGEDQWFYNDMPGNSTQVGGMHRCMSAFPAQASQISLWTGLFVWQDQPVTPSTVFDADSHLLYEFENPANPTLQNPGFESVVNLTPELGVDDVHRITLPDYWVPVGGGIGQSESYYTDSDSAANGAAGLRVYNKRGCFFRGVMQRVAVPQSAYQATFGASVRAVDTGEISAMVGIDPYGGTDIHAESVVWAAYMGVDSSWEAVWVTSPCFAPEVTLFLVASSDSCANLSGCWADFDDAVLQFDTDPTPPEPFDVIADTPVTLLHFLSAQITPEPYDPETGIAAVEYAVGTSPGSEDIRPFTQCEDWSWVAAAGLNLIPGDTYYITVRAVNGAGGATTSSSGPILCQPISNPYAWSPLEHLSQTSYNADNPRVAASSGSVFAVWRESDNACWDGDSSQVAFRERVGMQWADPVSVNSVPDAWWPDVVSFAGDCAVSYVTPGGVTENNLHIAVKDPWGRLQESTVAGGLSIFPCISHADGLGLVAASMRDVSGSPGLVEPALWSESSSWGAEVLPGGYSGDPMRVKIDAAGGGVHCVWNQMDAATPNLYYSRRSASGDYLQPVLVAENADLGDIAVTSVGEVHIVYVSDGEIWHTFSDDGAAFHHAQYIEKGIYAAIDAGPDDVLHAVVFADVSMANEHGTPLVVPLHLMLTESGWSTPAAVALPSCTSGIWAQEPGDIASDDSGSLHFIWSHNPHDRGWQGEDFQGYYWVDYATTGPTQPQGADTIAFAKLWGDDAPAAELGYPPSKTVSLQSKQVTAVGALKFEDTSGGGSVWKSVPCFYIQEDDRSSGIRVVGGNAQEGLPTLPLTPGDLVDVSGVISTINGERTIGYLAEDGTSQGVTYAAVGTAAQVIDPIFVPIRNLGGADMGPTLGVTGGTGLNNVGLLVRTAGRVVAADVDERGITVLWIDDGCQVACGQNSGCKIYADASQAQPGDWINVTGASSVEVFDPTPGFDGDEAVIRVIMPRDGSSVSQVSTGG